MSQRSGLHPHPLPNVGINRDEVEAKVSELYRNARFTTLPYLCSFFSPFALGRVRYFRGGVCGGDWHLCLSRCRQSVDGSATLSHVRCRECRRWQHCSHEGEAAQWLITRAPRRGAFRREDIGIPAKGEGRCPEGACLDTQGVDGAVGPPEEGKTGGGIDRPWSVPHHTQRGLHRRPRWRTSEASPPRALAVARRLHRA
ncbi:hypothetical protein B0H12DRAFT_1149153 [Mycena haematopus]|nr:hypothetical protein B0H12DRAFT_1149153 [Mycena haematopus]